ncbi:MAG: [FeFe] hydrogenase H-cluster radical SAM maturase HydE [Oscillospiraceae bacterium]|nr:[FeFe] hydrogenase H-cluster radical SAM maturase HydE [Oscillospiraceae bacterium]
MTIIEELRDNRNLSDDGLLTIMHTDAFDQELRTLADGVRRAHYGTDVYLRGLIEFTSYCKCSCFYCGLRCGNPEAQRYRMTKEEILECCAEGYALGYRTFVLQGGEDPFFDDDAISDIVASIRRQYDDCAITLSIGEKSYESYKAFFDAGANRYLLRHETADEAHYSMLHPENMSSQHRKQCLFQLKEIGYQVGSGFMVGSPFQTKEHLLADLRFLQELSPDMIGIGPFIPARNTPFAEQEGGSLTLTLRMISILRLMFPYALLPATTALGTIHPHGRELGLQAGANVVMPNLSPAAYREKYAIYDNKICTGDESAQCRKCLEQRVASAGYQVVTNIGNVKR